MRSEARLAALAGALAVAVAFGVGEFVAALSGAIPSPLDAIGQVLIPLFPPVVTSFAISTFGTANRAVLTAGTVLVGLGIGAWVGVVARRSFQTAVAVFGLFAALGIVAALDQSAAAFPLVLVASVAAASCGLWALWELLRRLPARELHTAASGAPLEVVGATTQSSTRSSEAQSMIAGDPRMPDVARRDFLLFAGGVGTAAVVTFGAGRFAFAGAGRRSVESTPLALPEPTRTLASLPDGSDLASRIDGVAPLFTPNDAFYRIDTMLGVPQVDPATWRLRILGLVDQEVELDYDELLAMPLEEVDATISCVSNEVGGDLVGTARWIGVPLGAVLDLAGVRDDAEQLVGRSADGWTAGFPVGAATDGRDALLAVGMNGEPLPQRHGFPARLVVPGLYGYVSATKWLTEIALTSWDDVDGYWVPRGWAKEAPVKTASRIDVPRDRTRLSAGEVTVGGVAWAPVRGIQAVELNVDESGWRPAELNAPLPETAWVQWSTLVDLRPGTHRLQVRAVDGDGAVQSEGPRPPAPDGAEGWHVVHVEAT